MAAIGEKLEVTASYPQAEIGEFRTDQNFTFEFRANPVINSVHPQEAISQWVTFCMQIIASDKRFRTLFRLGVGTW